MTQTQMFVTAITALVAVIMALAGAITYLGKRAFKKADDETKRACLVEDNALRRWEDGTLKLAEVTTALKENTITVRAVATALSNHDAANERAHKESSECLADVARVQSATLRQLELMNGEKIDGTRKSRK